MSATDPLFEPNAPVNPYAAPRADLEAPLDLTDLDNLEWEAVRRAHLNRETWIKTLGSLHYLGAFMGFLGIFFISVAALAGQMEMAPQILVIILIVYAALTAFNAAMGYGLRSFQPWARWTETVLYSVGVASGSLIAVACVALGIIPPAIVYGIGALFQGAVLYLLLSSKGSVVFSARYKEVIERTPHVRYQASAVVKFVVVLLVTLFAVSVLTVMMSKE